MDVPSSIALVFAAVSLPISPRMSRQTILWICVALNVAGIVLAGCNPKWFEFRNGVEWAPDGDGIGFGKPGLAYTETFTTQMDTDRLTGQGLTIEIALRPEEGRFLGFRHGLRFIAVVHSGDDHSQLLIAQWRQTIIVMNGDDYDNRRKSPRLTASVVNHDAGPLFLAARSDGRGTALYINGKSVATSAGLTLRLPTDDAPGRLVLGNSVYGDAPWRGTIAGFALHRVALDEDTLRHHLELWQRDQGFAGDDYASAQLAYPFSERTSRRALDRSPYGIDLKFPRETTAIAPKLFPFGIDSLRRGHPRDIIINLCGFIPLGFFLVALFAEVTPMTRLTAVGAAIAIGFTLSFGIELAQAWIPSRSSSLLDLLLNIAGSGLGGSAFALFFEEGVPDLICPKVKKVL